ncbi:MAG: dTDP-4-dehydrorhamnose 3,5-epimerase [Desulfobacterales bacterium]|nr:MAG: dTDP-4-dehydrorhamnose 3,5-epimerase [Desulfobacterales bacterium]
MKTMTTSLEGLLILEPRVFEDERGYFLETYHNLRYRDCGIDKLFVQDNLSFSTKNTLRGLHFQISRPQTKLVQVITGEIFDVAVDIRPGSTTFGKWMGIVLSEGNKRQFLIPDGFAHGFCVLSRSAHVAYKCTALYNPADEGGILWSDPNIGIDWPIKHPILSDKDRQLPYLSDLKPAQLLGGTSQ